MDEEIQDVAADTNAEVEETTNSNEPVEETVDAEKEELRRAKAQLTARAKKAEEELKTLKAKPQEQTNSPELSDELKLIARGLSDQAIEQAKVIAKGKNITLPEATEDPLFEIYQKDEADKKRREDAKLGASRGSGESQPEEPEFKSGMTKEEHEKAWRKSMGKK